MTAVITGASSGIGRAAAMTCAKKAMNVWMVDIDKEELDVAKELVMKECSKKDAQVCFLIICSSLSAPNRGMLLVLICFLDSSHRVECVIRP